jgi:hypothetical protein
MRIVLVISNQDSPRIKEFARIFADIECELLLVSGNGVTWSLVDSSGNCAPLANIYNPDSADVLLMHGGDYDGSLGQVKAKLVKGWGKAFIFNSPGSPPHKDGFIRILRPTEPASFGVTERHAKELIEYALASTRSAPLPSCCYEAAKHLVALDILCQGYLFTHEHHGSLPITLLSGKDSIWRKQTETREWWLKGLGVDSLENLTKELIEDKVVPDNAKRVVTSLSKAIDFHPAQQADDSGKGESKHDQIVKLRSELRFLLA